ncbi:hypothetical protein [Arcticibacter svalbardensis]|uniref:hypothetical protein n=1 Tax=Arcticibacter svalbardensis TaxID=1288027 RepID=UPI00058CD195|nr:hypothetical protein [Arcticibacter svalbardensis]
MFYFSLLFLFTCKKEGDVIAPEEIKPEKPNIDLPQVVTREVTYLTYYSVTIRGSVVGSAEKLKRLIQRYIFINPFAPISLIAEKRLLMIIIFSQKYTPRPN